MTFSYIYNEDIKQREDQQYHEAYIINWIATHEFSCFLFNPLTVRNSINVYNHGINYN